MLCADGFESGFEYGLREQGSTINLAVLFLQGAV